MTAKQIISRKAIQQNTLLTGFLVILLLLSSLAGILKPEYLYAKAELRATFLPNDVVNLVIGVPILLLSMFGAGRGSATACGFPIASSQTTSSN